MVVGLLRGLGWNVPNLLGEVIRRLCRRWRLDIAPVVSVLIREGARLGTVVMTAGGVR